MSAMVIVHIVCGLVLLVVGADILVRAASRLAAALGLSPLVIGLTVVAYGTSAPEFAVSVDAGLIGQADIAIGNVVGSNTLNVLFILGLSAAIVPLTVSSQLVRFDVPVMIGASASAWLFAANGAIARWEGVILVIGALVYTFLLVRNRVSTVVRLPAKKPAALGVLVLVALGCLAIGARWLVCGAVELARALRVSELLIGVTIVAAGTSLPELATSVVAAIRGEKDIAVGNIVGSNVFNIFAVLGTAAVVSGNVSVAPAALRFDIPVMAAVAVACLPVFFTGGRIARWEGILFVVYYVAYVTYLFLAAARHEAMNMYCSAVLWFALPATALGIGLSVAHAVRAKKLSRRHSGQ